MTSHDVMWEICQVAYLDDSPVVCVGGFAINSTQSAVDYITSARLIIIYNLTQ